MISFPLVSSGVRARTATLSAAVLLACGAVHAGGASVVDLATLSLEELMDVEISNTKALDVRHTHRAGELMFGYSFMTMDMKGNRKGSRRIGTRDVLDDFMVAPTRMTMEMHMLHVMYAPEDWITLGAMVPFKRLSMDHRTAAGDFDTESEGIGDVQLAALVTLLAHAPHQLHFEAGLSVPTGSIDERDDTPMADDARLPYPMQLGSGTFDLLPGLTYIGQKDSFVWGGHIGGTVRVGNNSNGYRLGDALRVSAWGGSKLTEWLSVFGALRFETWGNIRGDDNDLDPAVSPAADPDRRAGDRLMFAAGLNLFDAHGPLEGHRLSLEVGVPLYEYLDGPQLEIDWVITTSWQFMFSP